MICTCTHPQSVHTGGGPSDGGLCFPTGTTRDACPCEGFKTAKSPRPDALVTADATEAELQAFVDALTGAQGDR